ncbi:hypothetical protein C8R45DRAFT_1083456 [Mycena sanguinolenta]|nr:hypothetical protein C8R45DRAFT_1083456 [Mycena sanguinolenta]
MNSDNDPGFRARSVGTAMVLFAASSFVPVVVAAALAILTICLAVSAALVILLGLALLLTVVLSSALFHSAVITLLGAGALRLVRSPGGWSSLKASFYTSSSTTSDAPSETSNPNPTPAGYAGDGSAAVPRVALSGKNTYTLPFGVLPLLTRGSRKLALLAFVLACKAISVITSPRAVRHKRVFIPPIGAPRPNYPREPYAVPPLQRTLALPFDMLASLLTLAAAPFRLLGWNLTVLAACFTILIPIARGSIWLGSTVLRSEAVAQLRAGLVRVWAAAALACERWVRGVLAAVVAVLRTELERWEAAAARAAASASNLQPGSVHVEAAVETKHDPQPEDAEAYEMVSPAGTGNNGLSLGEMSTLRARKISGGGSEE